MDATAAGDGPAEFGLFRRLDGAERQRIERHGWNKSLARGAHLFQQGDRPNAVYLVVRGEVSCYCPSASGREVRERVCGPGQLLCPVAALDGGPAPASAQARTDVQLVAIPLELARESVRAGTALGEAMVQELCRCYRQAAGQLPLLALDGMDRRVAWTLTGLADQARPGAAAVALAITHADLAALMGTSREVVSRAMARLRRDGLVQTARGRVSIPDVAALARLAGRAG